MGWAKKSKRSNVKRTKRGRRVKRAPRQGGFFIRRRVKAFGLQGSASVPGAVSSYNTMLSISTPVGVVGGALNMYDVAFSIEFRLNNLEAYTELVAIADRYRITGAKVMLSGANTPGGGVLNPFVEYIEDHDEAGIPSISALSQKMGLRSVGFNQRGQLTMYCKPRPAVPLYDGVANLSYAVPRSAPYINTSYATIPHYAIKGVIRNMYLPGSASAFSFGVDVEMSVSCRDLQ